MGKIVYNACYGGFSLSDLAIRRYAEIKGISIFAEKGLFGTFTYWTISPEQKADNILEGDDFYSATIEERKASNEFYQRSCINDRDIDRDDPVLIQVVEELGSEANGRCANLRIEELPSGTEYRIDEYDGFESVEIKESYDWKVAK